MVLLMAKKKKKSWDKLAGTTGVHLSKRSLDAVDGKRAAVPSVDSPLPKPVRPVLAHLPWKEIEALYCRGISVEEIALEYPPATVSAINKRASRGEWMSPGRLKRKADAIMRKAQSKAKSLDMPLDTDVATVDDPIEALALKIAQGKLQHKEDILGIVGDSIKQLKDSGEKLKIRTFADLEKADNIGRKTLGLDAAEAENKYIFNMSAFGVAPVDDGVTDGVTIDV